MKEPFRDASINLLIQWSIFEEEDRHILIPFVALDWYHADVCSAYVQFSD